MTTAGGLAQIAHVNVARLAAPFGGPILQPFLDAMPDVNAAAETYPGFVWLQQTDQYLHEEQGDGKGVLTTMSVWRDFDALREFVVREPHLNVMRRRREWFLPMAKPTFAAWWIPEDHLPGEEEARIRLGHLRDHGPTSFAFTLGQAFPAGL
jgi:hypothetical protein